MLRFVLALIVVAVILAAVLRSPKHSTSAASDPSAPAYGEVRIKVALPQKELEFVMAGEKPRKEDCDRSTYRFPALCSNGIQCEITKVECGNSLADRYKNMLDQRPAQTHYVHFASNDGEARRYVLVGWGLTEEESKFVCQHVAANGAQKSNMKVTCI